MDHAWSPANYHCSVPRHSLRDARAGHARCRGLARLAIGGLTGPLDPADDYSLYWIVGYHNYPPVMRKEECPHIQTKFMGALPLMRISTGSSVNDHVDLAWMNSIAANRGGGGDSVRIGRFDPVVICPG